MSSSAASSSSSMTTSMTPRPLRRLTLELFAIIALKIIALTLIWWVVFSPQPKPDVSSAAVAGHMAPQPHAPAEAHP